MKRTFFLILFLAFVGFQTASAQILKLGVKGGVSVKNYDFSTVYINGEWLKPGVSPSIGYQMGVVLRLSIPKFIQIQPELLYSVQKYNYQTVNSSSMTSKTSFETKRLEMPVMIGFNISAFRLFAGPKFVLSSSSKADNDAVSLGVDFVDADVAFQAGIGLDIRKFFIEATYSTYLGDNFDQFTYNGTTCKTKIKNDDQFSFNLGFFF